MSTDLWGAEVPAPRRPPSAAAIGAHDEHLTPPDLLARLGPFDLDPCASRIRPWDTAAKHYTVVDDGLRQPWHGFVWCNPPFSRAGVWMAKLAGHGNGIALLAVRAETRDWQTRVLPRCSGVLFLARRMKFHRTDGTQQPGTLPASIALVAYGDLALQRLRAAADLGRLLVPDPLAPAPRSTPDPEEISA